MVTHHICLSSHFPPYTIDLTNDLCTKDDKFRVHVNFFSASLPLSAFKVSLPKREEMK